MMGFTTEGIAMILDMSTPVNRNVRDEPHPHWVHIQTARSPCSPRSSLSAPEKREVMDYDNEEDWDVKDGKERLKSRPLVSKTNQSVKSKICKRKETKETRKVNVEALIEQKLSERVYSFLKEHTILNESLNSHVNLTG